MGKQIKDFPRKHSSNNNDLILIQDENTQAYMNMSASDFLAGNGAGWILKNGNCDAFINDKLLLDLSQGSFTISLPPNPLLGSEIELLSTELTKVRVNLNLNNNLFNKGTFASLTFQNSIYTKLVYTTNNIGWILTVPDVFYGGYRQEILKDSPIGFWEFEEEIGTLAVNIGSGMSNGTHNNITFVNPGLIFDSKRAVFYNNNTSTSNTIFTNTLTTIAPCSLEAIVRLDSTSLQGSFIKIGGTLNGIAFGVGGSTLDEPGNNLIGLAEGIAWVRSGKAIGVGVHHVGMSFRSSNNGYYFYLDGQLVGSGTSSINAASGTGYIGGYFNDQGGRRFVAATIDQVAIYNKELSFDRWLAHAVAAGLA